MRRYHLGQDHPVLRALAQAAAPQSLDALWQALRGPWSRARISCALHHFSARLLVVHQTGGWRMTPAGLAMANDITGQQRMWKAMRVAQCFDKRDIAFTANVALSSAGTYIGRLFRAGYLRLVIPGRPGTPARYRLTRWTGQSAPQVTSTKTVRDINQAGTK